MNEEILKLLRCVEGNCNGSLDYIESSEKTLVCKSCNHNYKFIHDIPILMSEESFQLFNKSDDTFKLFSSTYNCHVNYSFNFKHSCSIFIR